MRKKREAGLTKRSNKEAGLTAKGLTEYPAILHALVDLVKRRKLERIYQSLKERRLTRDVWYGIGGVDFETVGDLLEATG